MRVYVPLDFAGLERLSTVGELGPPPLSAYAATPALGEVHGSDDVEELEYAAMVLAGSRAWAVPVVVVAADSGSVRVDRAAEPGAVVVTEPVPLAAVASIHVAETAEEELAWYAPQELAQLLSSL